MTSHTVCLTRIGCIALAALVAIAIAIPASFAQTPAKDSEIRSMKVDFADLNLATDAGSRALYHRLVSAAQRVCPETSPLPELSQNREARRCIAETVERAVKQINHPKFAQVAAAYAR